MKFAKTWLDLFGMDAKGARSAKSDTERLLIEHLDKVQEHRRPDVAPYITVPPLSCRDGFSMQAMWKTKSFDPKRVSKAKEKGRVYILGVNAKEPLLDPYEMSYILELGGSMYSAYVKRRAYGFPDVPLSVVVKVIDKHGGIGPFLGNAPLAGSGTTISARTARRPSTVRFGDDE